MAETTKVLVIFGVALLCMGYILYSAIKETNKMKQEKKSKKKRPQLY